MTVIGYVVIERNYAVEDEPSPPMATDGCLHEQRSTAEMEREEYEVDNKRFAHLDVRYTIAEVREFKEDGRA
jgi:hypothetical protein